MIELQNVTKYFGDFPAITDISFTVERGERVGFLGPNGAGKSTTMKIVTGFMPPSEGRVTVAGYDIVSQSLEARRRIGYLPETVPLYTDMFVDEYLRFMGTIRGMTRNKDLTPNRRRSLHLRPRGVPVYDHRQAVEGIPAAAGYSPGNSPRAGNPHTGRADHRDRSDSGRRDQGADKRPWRRPYPDRQHPYPP